MARSQKTDTRNNYVPSDYEDLYRYYVVGNGKGDSLVHQLLRKMMKHATDDERETLAHDVFLRLIEHKMLDKFDPTKGNFGGVVYFVTRTIVGNHLARKGRNPVTGLSGGSIVESDGKEEGEFEPGVYSLDRLPQTSPNYEARMDAQDLVSKLYGWAKDLAAHPRHKRDESLVVVIEQMAEGREAFEIAAKLEVTTSTVSNWQKVIREKAQELRSAH